MLDLIEQPGEPYAIGSIMVYRAPDIYDFRVRITSIDTIKHYRYRYLYRAIVLDDAISSSTETVLAKAGAELGSIYSIDLHPCVIRLR